MLLLVAGLATVYVIYFSDWFAPRTFKIFHTSRNLHAGFKRPGALPSLTFGISRELLLTELKVVPLEAWQTNKNALPLWHLLSDSNSVPVKAFFYGQPIAGLHPAIKGTHPEMPETNVTYRLFLTAGKFTSWNDFEVK